jgi:L,D-transpeptidase catalytic domain
MGKPWWHILIISAIALFLTMAVFLIFYPVPSPPVGKMKNAREAISLARKNRADVYSSQLFREASDCYDSAMADWKRQNRVFIYKRNYGKVTALAELSSKNASEASEIALNNTTNYKVVLKERLEDLRNLMAEINKIFPTYPLTPEVRNKISMGKMLISESETAFDNGDYLQAEQKISESKNLLESSYDFASSNLKSYFRSYPQWKIWADSTIAMSRENHDYSIIVDKFSHKFFVYLDGTIITEFTAELGKNWVGHKRRRGDKATPEGMYRITQKIEGDSTTFYKAFMLDYPNEEDTIKFREAIESGALSPSARIGDMIEIHGNGGKGVDWTAGCVALKDREMDSIFKYINVGTPVTIVGSVYSLKHVFKK